MRILGHFKQNRRRRACAGSGGLQAAGRGATRLAIESHLDAQNSKRRDCVASGGLETAPPCRMCSFKSRSAFRLALLLFLATTPPSFAATAGAAATTGAAAVKTGTAALHDGDIVQLDTLTVTEKAELPPPEVWYYAKIPGLDVFSNASMSTTKRLLKDFEDFRIALEAVWPVASKPQQPCTLVFCARNSFAQFLPQTTSSTQMARASVTLIGPEHAFIVINLGTPTMMLDGTQLALDMDMGDGSTLSNSFDVDYFRLLDREYVHYLLSQADTPPPVWYEEGMLQIIQKMDVEATGIKFGAIKQVNNRPPKNPLGIPRPASSAVSANPASLTTDDDDSTDDLLADTSMDATADMPGSETISDGDFNVVLAHQALLGFQDFFGVTRDSPVANNPIGNNVWAKQCYAFVHMCLFAIPNKYKAALATFVDRAGKEPVTEQLFAECFGKPYDKFLVELRGYIDFTTYKYADYAIKGKDRINTPQRDFTQIKEGSGARMKAEALLLANNSIQAIPALRGSYGRGERDPDFLATYGLVMQATNQKDNARRLLSQAIAKNTTRAAAYTAYANILLADAGARPAAPDRVSITPEQLAPVLEQLFTARKFPPALPQTYETIAGAWLKSSVAPTNENFSVLTEGLALFPNDPELIYRAAQLLLRMDNRQAAAALLAHGLKVAPDDATREKLAQLNARLAPRAD